VKRDRESKGSHDWLVVLLPLAIPRIPLQQFHIGSLDLGTRKDSYRDVLAG
jgi:hypothetical protein